MAGEIYLSNLSGQFDYQTILQKYQEIKFQQVQLIQQKEQAVQKQESAFKTFANMLQDFKNDFEALVDPKLLDQKSVQVSDESVATVTITDASKLQDISLDFTVGQLAKNDVWLSEDGVASKDDTPATTDGTLTLSINGNDITIDYSASDTLAQIVDKINQASDDVAASFFYDGSNYRLLLSGTHTGANNTLSMSDTGDLLDNLQLGSSHSGSHVQAAQNAKINIFNQEVESPTNTFSNVIDGLEITVHKETSDPVTLSITSDEESAKKAFIKVLDDYNSLVDYIKQVTGKDGDLSGDYTLHAIRSAIFDRLTPLMEAGLLQVDHKTGHLTLDTAKFDELYKNDKDRLKNLQTSLKNSLEPYLEALFDPRGIIEQKEKSYERQIDRYEETIQSVAKRIQKETEMMKRQFVHLDAMMAQMNDIKMRLAAILPKEAKQ